MRESADQVTESAGQVMNKIEQNESYDAGLDFDQLRNTQILSKLVDIWTNLLKKQYT